MYKSHILNDNKILKNIRENYGRINERLVSESIRILNDDYNIKVGDIVVDKYNYIGMVTGAEVDGLENYLIYNSYKQVLFRVHTLKFNLNGSFNKNNHSLHIYSDISDKVKVVGNISEYKTDKDRMKLFKSLNLKRLL